MNKNQLTSKLFTVRCEHQQGMLSFILTFFERPGYEVLSVSQAPTDINGIILIMVEVAIPARKAEEFVPKIESIDGVIDIVISYGSFIRAGFFRLSTSRLTAGFWDLVGRNRAVVIHRSGGSILLETWKGRRIGSFPPNAGRRGCDGNGSVPIAPADQ